ncbi:hypothetical protein cypCar_00049158 [Cyprinus carpio]|nr:hypothetical protein cypCar_00049158 [Cyprinus carpio]
MRGYINFTLSVAPANFTQSYMTCRYRGLRDDKGQPTQDYYHLLAIRLSFVIIFEHVVLLIGRIIDWMVPDIPEEVEIKIKREHYMAKEALAENQSLNRTILEEMEQQISELRFRGRTQSPNNISSLSSLSPEHKNKPTV